MGFFSLHTPSESQDISRLKRIKSERVIDQNGFAKKCARSSGWEEAAPIFPCSHVPVVFTSTSTRFLQGVQVGGNMLKDIFCYNLRPQGLCLRCRSIDVCCWLTMLTSTTQFRCLLEGIYIVSGGLSTTRPGCCRVATLCRFGGCKYLLGM